MEVYGISLAENRYHDAVNSHFLISMHSISYILEIYNTQGIHSSGNISWNFIKDKDSTHTLKIAECEYLTSFVFKHFSHIFISCRAEKKSEYFLLRSLAERWQSAIKSNILHLQFLH